MRILITPQAECGAGRPGAGGRCSGQGIFPHCPGCRGRAAARHGSGRAGKAGALQPDVGCNQNCGISAETIRALMRNVPSPALQLCPLRRQAWGNPCLTPASPLTTQSSKCPFPTAGPSAELPHLHMLPQFPREGQKGAARICFPIISSGSPAPAPLRASAAALPPQTCLSTSSAGTNLPYVSANRGNCWNQCLIGFRLWQTACRYIFLCQSRRGRRGARELGDAEWK